MRRLVVPAVLLALAVPAAGLAHVRAPGDGTLSVRSADGYVALNLRGAVVGRVSGKLEIIDPRDGDCSAETVWGVRGEPLEQERRVGLVCTYLGQNLRFRLVGGQQWLRADGTDIGISAVGRGSVWLRSSPTSNRGSYSFDGDRFASLPPRLTQFSLGLPFLSGGSG